MKIPTNRGLFAWHAVLLAGTFLVNWLIYAYVFRITDLVNQTFITTTSTIIAILIGFIATTFSTFFYITDKPVFVRIRDQGLTHPFTAMFKRFFVFGLCILIMSLLLVSEQFKECISFYLLYMTLIELFVFYAIELFNRILFIFEKVMDEP